MISEALSTFRKKINLQAFLVTLFSVILVVVYILLRFYTDPVIQGIAWITGLFGAFLGISAWIRRMQLLRLVKRKTDPDQTVRDVETFLTKQSEEFHAGTPVRISIAIVLALGMVLSIHFRPDSFYTGAIIMAFVAMILTALFMGWMNMQYLMMLQDLKHAKRDQTSDIS